MIEELKERMKTPAAKERYGKRCCTVERRFADSKTHRGLQRFSGQTPERADAQVGLTMLAHNLRTLAKLRAFDVGDGGRRRAEFDARKRAE